MGYDESIAVRMYDDAKKHNLRNDPGDAALAYSLFARAAHLGHQKTKSDLAAMMFFGSGGPKEQARAMGLAWQVFAPNDVDPLESLAEQLRIYESELVDPAEQAQASKAAYNFEQAIVLLRDASGYVNEIARLRMVELHRTET